MAKPRSRARPSCPGSQVDTRVLQPACVQVHGITNYLVGAMDKETGQVRAAPRSPAGRVGICMLNLVAYTPRLGR